MYEATGIDEDILAKLPEPAGYRLLIATLKVSEKASILGLVLKVGPEAYSDADRFPSGPYCKAGDFVIFRSYSGTRFKIENQEFRLINDDTVEGVVDDPRGYKRA